MPILRHSKKRDAMLELMRATDCHPSADWVYRQLRRRFPDLSLGTVYRNLSQLVEEGLIKSVGVVDGQERFDARLEPHAHFVCSRCGRVLDLPNCVSEDDLAPLGREYGFTPTSYELHIYGTCQNCAGDRAV